MEGQPSRPVEHPSLITPSLHTSSPLEFHFVSESVLILQLCTRSLSSALLPPLPLTKQQPSPLLSSPLLHPLFPFRSSLFLCLLTKDQPGRESHTTTMHPPPMTFASFGRLPTGTRLMASNTINRQAGKPLAPLYLYLTCMFFFH